MLRAVTEVNSEEQYKNNLRYFNCCTFCATFLAVLGTSLNILAIQHATSNTNDDSYDLVYGWDALIYEANVDGTTTSTTYTYEDIKDSLEEKLGGAYCDSDTWSGVCDGIDQLANGGSSYVGCVTTAIVCLFTANILSCFWIIWPSMPSVCFMSHWTISVSCVLAAIFYWAGFGTWQGHFNNNDAVDRISDVLYWASIADTMNNATVYEPMMGWSVRILIAAGICALFASCYAVDFSRQRQRNGPEFFIFGDNQLAQISEEPPAPVPGETTAINANSNDSAQI